MKIYLPIILLGLFISEHVPAQWTQCNGPYGGSLAYVAQNPATQTIFAGSQTIGLYRLQTNTNGWYHLQNDFGFSQVTGIAATKNFLFVIAGYSRLYSSGNEGNSWLQTDNLPLLLINSISTDNNTAIIGGSNFSNVEMYYYTTNGVNFTSIPLPSSKIAYVSVSNGRVIACYTDGNQNLHIEHSDNWGQTWMSSNVASIPGPSYLPRQAGPIIQYNDSSYLYIQGSLQFVSGDNGTTWMHEQCGAQPFCGYPFNQLIESNYGLLDAGPNGLSYYDTAWHNIIVYGQNLQNVQFIYRYQNDLYVYSSTDSLTFKSADGGATWQTGFYIPYGPAISDIVNNGNTINIYSENNVLYYSENGLTLASDSTNPPYLNDFTDVQYINNRAYALANSDRTLCSSDDNGTTWDTLQWARNYDQAFYSCNFSGLAANSEVIVLPVVHVVYYPYSLESFASILYSHDGGLTFAPSSSNFPAYYSARNPTALLGNKAFFADRWLFKSNDAGVSWYQDTLLNDSLTTIYTIAPNFVVLGSSSGEIFFSSDTGNTFKDITGNYSGLVNQFYFLGTSLYAVTSSSGLWKMDATQLGIPNNFYAKQQANGTGQAAIFPNPARNSITINLATDLVYSGLSYKIYNAWGQLLKNGTAEVLSGSFSLSTASLLKGVYYLQLQNINDNKGIKFVVD